MYSHKITCMFDVLKQNGECLTHEHAQIYRPLKFHHGYCERESYHIDKTAFTWEDLVTDQRVLTRDGTLVIVGHLLFEATESAVELGRPSEDQEKHLQKCKSDNSTVYKNVEMKQKSGILSLTSSKVQLLKITWKVPKYDSLLEKPLGYSLSSPSFNFLFATWFLKLYPVEEEENDSVTGLSIVRSHSLHPLFHEIIYTCDIVTEDDKPFSYNFYTNYKYKKMSFDEVSEMKESSRHIFYTRTMLVDCLAVDDDGNVTFLMQIFYDETPVKDAALQKMLYELNMYRTFGGDLKNFLLNGSGHDLTLKVKEREFRVHRQILSSRSPVFASMLMHNMTEKNYGVVSIPDCDPPVIEQFLLYVYCGKVELLDETNVQELYYVADKYDVMHLKEVCRGFIRNSLSCRNVCAVVQLARNHSDEDLAELATEYFVKNKNEILTTAEWTSFKRENENIADEILNKASEEASGQEQKERGKKRKHL